MWQLITTFNNIVRKSLRKFNFLFLEFFYFFCFPLFYIISETLQFITNNQSVSFKILKHRINLKNFFSPTVRDHLKPQVVYQKPKALRVLRSILAVPISALLDRDL